ncbi:hypothetical protein MPDQ_004140 [Monascus purpureus]|uniref:Major facilitator superfamily (MFS) profile domain-containing protein n=1 Tax=Monascus purpureus TaxID=5098 RepID=A0A507QK97_MONPU|nr:hypothetical protein MPDQ_004140 [Monascus purpureus]
MEKKMSTEKSTPVDIEPASTDGQVSGDIDPAVERSYVRKVDVFLLPLLCLMYFFDNIDRSNLGNAKTDGLDRNLHFVGNDYSLLILLFYVPFGLCDLPWNLLTKRYSARVTLSIMSLAWGILGMLQCATHSFGGLLAVRLLLGIFEAGFYAGVTYYLTLFYTRSELGFRLAIFQSFAVISAAFSGLIAYGVFQIDNPHVYGWQWLFIIEGGMTFLCGIVACFWLPARPQTAWFLNEAERSVATARQLRNNSSAVESRFNLRDCFRQWSGWRFPVWCVITLTYPVAFATTGNFLPQIVQRLGFSTVKTNLWTVAPNAVGAVVLLVVCKSSDYFRERTFHIIVSLIISLVGMIILAAIDAVENKGVAYFACFMMAGGAYIPSILVHAWHNNNNLNENSRAANTGLFVGLGNLGGILSAATFRTEYAPKYAPTLIATSCCNGVCIVFTLVLGLWMKRENARRNREQGVQLRAGDVDTRELADGENSPQWRYFT